MVECVHSPSILKVFPLTFMEVTYLPSYTVKCEREDFGGGGS